MSSQFGLGDGDSTSWERSGSTKKRRPQKTDEQKLADLMAKTEALNEKVLKQRDRRRAELIEELLERHGVDTVDGDLGEAQRLAKLREKLGM